MNYCFKCMMPLGADDVCPSCGYTNNGNAVYPAHILLPGTVLKERYLIGAVLGQGGFGITYIGRDLVLDIRVAVKEYFPAGYVIRNNKVALELTYDDKKQKEFVEKGKVRFLQEAKVLAQFHGNQGIVDVRDFFEENGTAYIIMDYLEGEDLREILKKKLFTPDEIFDLMNPVFRTLEQIHNAGVVHCDISPDNIMMLKDGTLKLMDFGAARLANYTDQRSVSVVLKTGYAPEEQYRPKGKQGPWTDIYALCATIYKCITGITPDDALERMADDQHRWPSELGYSISARQEAVLKKGMSILAKDRYQNLGELVADLAGKDEQGVHGAEIGSAEHEDPSNLNGKIDTEKTIYDNDDSEQTVLEGSEEKTVYDAAFDGETVYDPGVSGSEEKTVYTGGRETNSGTQAEADDSSAETNKKRKQKSRNLFLVVAAIAVIIAVVVFGKGILRSKPDSVDDVGQQNQTADSGSGADSPADSSSDSSKGNIAAQIRRQGNYLAVGDYNTVALRDDGHVVVKITKDYADHAYYGKAYDLDATESWSNICGVAAGELWTFGIKEDGTVLITGGASEISNSGMEFDIMKWTDIVKIDCDGGTFYETVKTATGSSTTQSKMYHTIGLKGDGTVVATGESYYGECEVQGWKEIVDIAAGWRHTLGLRSDGTVVAAGYNDNGQCDVSEWNDIVQVEASKYYSIGLRSDGTVVIAGGGGQFNINTNEVANWRGIKRIYATHSKGSDVDVVIGVAEDGRVVSCGDPMYDIVSKLSDVEVCVCSSWGYIAYLNSDGEVHAITALDENKDMFGDRLGEPLWNDIAIPGVWQRDEDQRKEKLDDTSASNLLSYQDVKKGSVITFGHYEQDCNSGNGKEDIEWIVLDVQGDRAFVVSRYALDAKRFGYDKWKKSTLRLWLNGNFIQEAFSDTEQFSIVNTTIETSGSGNTEDRVFLLSSEEATQYLGAYGLSCKTTDYAVENGASKTDEGYCWWWLRTPGEEEYVSIVRYNGEIDSYGFHAETAVSAVRPAMWVKLG